MQRQYQRITVAGLGLLLLAGVSACGAGASVATPPATSAPVMNPAANPPASPGATTPPVVDPGSKPVQGGSDLPLDYTFSVSVNDTSFKYGGSAASFDTTWSYVADRKAYDDLTGIVALDLSTLGELSPSIPLIEVKVHARDAVGLKMAFMTLTYDGARLQPLVSGRGTALGPDALGSVPEVNPVPGQVRFATLLPQAASQAGFTGADGVVGKYYFRPPGYGTNDPGTALGPQPALRPDCAASLSYDAADGALVWGYQLPGDFDQNGLVDFNDFAVWAARLGDPVDSLDSIQGVIHNSASGAVGVLDLQRWGQHDNLGATSYNVYSGAAADYPAGGTLLGNVALSSATGDPALERLQLAYALASPAAGTHYWVRPVSSGGLGMASNDLEF